MKPFIWYLKQLLPLRYKAIYDLGAWKRKITWNMWFGKVFNMKDIQIGYSEQFKKNNRK